MASTVWLGTAMARNAVQDVAKKTYWMRLSHAGDICQVGNSANLHLFHVTRAYSLLSGLCNQWQIDCAGKSAALRRDCGIIWGARCIRIIGDNLLLAIGTTIGIDKAHRGLVA